MRTRRLSLVRGSACASLLLAAGCQSSVRQASHTANLIRDTARSSETRFEIIEREIAAPASGSASGWDGPDVVNIAAQAAAGVQEQQRIQKLVGGIQETLTATQDRTSPWIGVLNLWGWIALAGLSVFVVGYFGIAPMLRRALHIWFAK